MKSNVKSNFDSALSFDNHISTTVPSCMSKLSQISRIRFVFYKELLETIIKALVSVNSITVRLYGHPPQPVMFVNIYEHERIVINYNAFKTLPRELFAT